MDAQVPEADLADRSVTPVEDVPQGLYFEDLEVGLSAELVRIVTAEDIQAFAEVSGDFNPVHLDEDYAAGTMFKQRISHGILS
ncbi:MAG: MaoC/PaaZ C-terminal domain-containing protein, partial [Hyphomicrobiaceae bacterium]